MHSEPTWTHMKVLPSINHKTSLVPYIYIHQTPSLNINKRRWLYQRKFLIWPMSLAEKKLKEQKMMMKKSTLKSIGMGWRRRYIKDSITRMEWVIWKWMDRRGVHQSMRRCLSHRVARWAKAIVGRSTKSPIATCAIQFKSRKWKNHWQSCKRKKYSKHRYRAHQPSQG